MILILFISIPIKFLLDEIPRKSVLKDILAIKQFCEPWIVFFIFSNILNDNRTTKRVVSGLLLMLGLSILLLLLAIFNSTTFDYMLRMKLNGIDLTQTIIRQMPVPQLDKFDEIIQYNKEKKPLISHILSRVIFLLQNDSRLDSFIKMLKSYSYPINSTRNKCMIDLDILIAYAYDIDQDSFMEVQNHFSNEYDNEERDYLTNNINILSK